MILVAAKPRVTTDGLGSGRTRGQLACRIADVRGARSAYEGCPGLIPWPFGINGKRAKGYHLLYITVIYIDD